MKIIKAESGNINIIGDRNVVSSSNQEQKKQDQYKSSILKSIDKFKSNQTNNSLLKLASEDEGVSLYSLYNSEILQIYNDIIHSENNASKIINCHSSILHKHEWLMNFIISQEVRDFHEALSTSNQTRPILCMDSSLETDLVSLWKKDSPYHDLNNLAGRLLVQLPPEQRKVERIFLFEDINRIVQDQYRLMIVHNILQEHFSFGINVYCVAKKKLPETYSNVDIKEEILNFHVIPEKLVDIMDIDTLLSYRFTYSSKESKKIIDSFEDIFGMIKKHSLDEKTGFGVKAGWSINRLKSAFMSCCTDKQD